MGLEILEGRAVRLSPLYKLSTVHIGSPKPLSYLRNGLTPTVAQCRNVIAESYRVMLTVFVLRCLHPFAC